MSDVAILLLAAGASQRMGRPKQLLPVAGRSLLRRAAEVSVESLCRPIVVVLGASADELKPELLGLPIEIVRNGNWERGIGTSIRAGVAHLTTRPAPPQAVLILLCDQPLISAATLCHLVSEHQSSGQTVTAAEFDGTLGPPVIVSAALFPDLLTLPDARGAKHLWLSRFEIVHSVPCPEAAVDVDTPADYQRLLQHK